VDIRQVRLQLQRQIKQQVGGGGGGTTNIMMRQRHCLQVPCVCLAGLHPPAAIAPAALSTHSFPPKERRIQELEAQLAEAQEQLEGTRALRAVGQDALDQAR
jgi:hypothetical protein